MEKSKKTLIILSAIFTVIIIAVLALFFNEKKTNSELLKTFELDKADLENEYSNFAQQYDELQLTITNDSLAVLLEREQIKTQRLLDELKSVKSGNATEIRRLKKELSTLRKVMVSYINQIDSLNKENQEQKRVIEEVTKKYSTASKTITNLNKQRKELNEKVTLAAQLDATNIWAQAKNDRGRNVSKIKNASKIHIGFTINKNITAKTGERILYIVITLPDQSTLTKDASQTFKYENKELPFSIKKYIEFDGEEQDVIVYWDVEEFLYAGEYRISIFSDGLMVGSEVVNFNK